MDYNKRRKSLTALLYSVLALMLITITGVTVFMTAFSRKEPSLEDDMAKLEEQLKSEAGVIKSDEAKDENDTADSSSESESVGVTESTPENGDDKAAAEKETKTEAMAEQTEEEIPPVCVFSMPVENAFVTKEYSVDVPVYSLTMDDYRTHSGIDIYASAGSPVLCVCDGTVENVYDDPLMGKSVIISHENGIKSVYMNLAEEVMEEISEGASVLAGQIIGAIGDTSLVELADESHLHFEMWDGTTPVDPLSYIPYDPHTAMGEMTE